MEEAIGYYESALSENTRRAYDRGWEDFVEFCDTYGRQALPDSKETVAVYLSERAGQLSPSKLKQRLAAIEAVHDL
jgi:site-specific recombinase XerD